MLSNDRGNQPWENMVVHNVDGSIVDDDGRPVRRGLPSLGKICFCTVTGGGMTAGITYVCIDTEPDPGHDGGGTWVPLGAGGGVYEDWPTVGGTIATQGVALTTTAHYARAAMSGSHVDLEAALQFASGGTGGSPVVVDTGIPGSWAFGGNKLIGTWDYERPGSPTRWYQGYVWAFIDAGTVQLVFREINSGSSSFGVLGSDLAITVASGHVLTFTGSFENA